MSDSEEYQLRKQKLLQRLNSLSPGTRQALLLAALEQKALRACIEELKDSVQYNQPNVSIK